MLRSLPEISAVVRCKQEGSDLQGYPPVHSKFEAKRRERKEEGGNKKVEREERTGERKGGRKLER